MFKGSARVVFLAAAAALLAAAAGAQTVQLGSTSSITLKGFISATFFGQDQNFVASPPTFTGGGFGNGQNAEFPAAPEATTDRWFYGGDVRNTRLTLAFDGPKIVGDWKVNATLEGDFFGGFNGTGAFSGQQPDPRLRLAFVDFTNGSTTIRMGQQWSPLFGNVAVSLSHIAFPLGYGSAGDVGWRFPGIFLYQNLTAKGAPINADLQFAIMENNWTAPPGTTIDQNNAGNAGTPQFELRVNLGGKSGDMSWSTYVVGHYDQKDLTGPGATANNDKLNADAVELGLKFQYGGFLFQGNGYTGHAMGQNFGAITQFGKIQSSGGWLQAGYDFDKTWGLFGFWGLEDPKDKDVLTPVIGSPGTARRRNEMFAAMVRWHAGPLAFGLEWMQDKLTVGAVPEKINGKQVSLSALYTF
jgi:hypothetical protein